MSVILISHDLRGVATRCDRIAVMYAGRLVELAPSQRLYRSMAMHYTKALIDATPQLSAPSHKRLSAIDGRPPDLAALPPGCAFAPRCPAATERCRQARPPLVPHLEDPGHLFACWNPLGAPQSSPAKGPAS
jgi:peptide/nickel transport system ATP-binding protein